MNFFAPRCLSCILYAAPGDKDKLLDEVHTLAVAVLDRNDYYGGRNLGPLLRTFLIFAHAAAGKGAELVTWSEKQPDTVKAGIRFKSFTDATAQFWHPQYYSFWKGKPFAIEGHKNAAAELLTSLLTDKDLAAIEVRQRTNISNMETSGMFDMDTIKAAIQAVPDTFPRKPEYLTELAGNYAWRKNNGKAALETWQLAEDIDMRLHASAYLNTTRASRFHFFVDCKRDAEAAAALPSIDRSKLDARMQTLFDRRAATLKQRTGKKESD